MRENIHTLRPAVCIGKVTPPTMDDQDMSSSPRKRLKLGMETTMPGSEVQTPSEQPAAPDEALSATTKPSMDYYELQLRKEEDVGITEFVSPDLPGFSGVLKKRFFSMA